MSLKYKLTDAVMNAKDFLLSYQKPFCIFKNVILDLSFSLSTFYSENGLVTFTDSSVNLVDHHLILKITFRYPFASSPQIRFICRNPQCCPTNSFSTKRCRRHYKIACVRQFSVTLKTEFSFMISMMTLQNDRYITIHIIFAM